MAKLTKSQKKERALRIGAGIMCGVMLVGIMYIAIAAILQTL